MTAKEATIGKIETREEAKVPIDPVPGVSTHLPVRKSKTGTNREEHACSVETKSTTENL
jgi:hypothetical protein